MADFNTVNLAQIYGAADEANARQQQQQYQQYQIQRQQKEDSLGDATRGAYRVKPDGTLDEKGTLAELLRVNPQEGLKFNQQLQTQRAAQDKATREAQTAKLGDAEKTYNLLKQSSGAVLAMPTLQNAIQQTTRFGKLTGQDVTSEIANLNQIGDNPEQIKRWAAGHSLSAEQLLPKNQSTDYGGYRANESVDPITGQVTQTGRTNKTQSPDSIASNANAIRLQNMRDATENSKDRASVADISPDAIDAAARRYRIDGTIPALGMGKSAAAMRAQILNKASELDKAEGIGGNDARTNQITGKAQTASVAALNKQKTMVGSFEKNALANADMALQLSGTVDRTGVPLLNRVIQSGQTNITGNPDLAKFHAANETFVNEYAKVMSGSMGNTPVSDSARTHAHSILSTAQTPQQYAETMATLKQEMANRMNAFDDESNSLTNSLNRNTSNNSQHSSATAAPSLSVTAPNGKVYNFKSAAQANEFKRQAGIK